MKKNNFLILLALIFFSCVAAYEIDISRRKVVLLAPVNNLSTTEPMHTFYWALVDGAGQYQLQIVSPRFDSIVRLVVDTTLDRNTFPIVLAIGTYQWRVRAKNSAYNSEFSDVWNLIIQ
ncbi:MAG: hypothetical protein E6H07_16855 [Bacteroidetes bacterium]|nr:MAG: hypothetical protein E6H07_16855 [Bacteroidota bacterium]